MPNARALSEPTVTFAEAMHSTRSSLHTEFAAAARAAEIVQHTLLGGKQEADPQHSVTVQHGSWMASTNARPASPVRRQQNTQQPPPSTSSSTRSLLAERPLADVTALFQTCNRSPARSVRVSPEPAVGTSPVSGNRSPRHPSALRQRNKENCHPRITPMARNMKRPLHASELAYMKGQEYQAHKELLRQKAELAELQQLAAPRINRRRSVSPGPRTPFGERLHNSSREYAAKRQHTKQVLAEQAADQIRNPEINDASKVLRRDPEAMFRWELEKQLKLRDLSHQIKQEETKECRTPKLAPKSREIVKNQARYATPVEDRLIFAGEEIKERQELNRRRDKMRKEVEATPVISPQSSSVRRPGPVHQRLFMEHKIQNLRRRDSIERELRRQSSPIDFVTGEKLYSPRISQRSHELAGESGEPIHERLLRQGELDRLKREEMVRQMQSVEEERRKVQRYIGPYSTLLNEIVEARSNTPTWVRATSSPRSQSPELSVNVDQAATFKPTISDTSRYLDELRNGQTNPTERIAALYRKQSDAEKRRQHMQEQRIIEEMRELRPSPKGNPSPSFADTSSFHDKNVLWKKKVETKRQRERIENEQRSMQECTFRPNLQPAIPSPGRTSQRRLSAGSFVMSRGIAAVLQVPSQPTPRPRTPPTQRRSSISPDTASQQQPSRSPAGQQKSTRRYSDKLQQKKELTLPTKFAGIPMKGHPTPAFAINLAQADDDSDWESVTVTSNLEERSEGADDRHEADDFTQYSSSPSPTGLAQRGSPLPIPSQFPVKPQVMRGQTEAPVVVETSECSSIIANCQPPATAPSPSSGSGAQPSYRELPQPPTALQFEDLPMPASLPSRRSNPVSEEADIGEEYTGDESLEQEEETISQEEYERQREQLLRQIEQTKQQLAMERQMRDHSDEEDYDEEYQEEDVHAQRQSDLYGDQEDFEDGEPGLSSPQRSPTSDSEREQETTEYDSFLHARQEIRKQHRLERPFDDLEIADFNIPDLKPFLSH